MHFILCAPLTLPFGLRTVRRICGIFCVLSNEIPLVTVR